MDLSIFTCCFSTMILEDRFTVAISFCKRYTIALFKIYNNYQLIRFFKYSKGVFDLYSFEKINDKYSCRT